MWSSVPDSSITAAVPAIGIDAECVATDDLGTAGHISPSLQSVSSNASARRLEWDSAADVGYRESLGARTFQSLDTLERVARHEYLDVDCRLSRSSNEVAEPVSFARRKSNFPPALLEEVGGTAFGDLCSPKVASLCDRSANLSVLTDDANRTNQGSSRACKKAIGVDAVSLTRISLSNNCITRPNSNSSTVPSRQHVSELLRRDSSFRSTHYCEPSPKAASPSVSQVPNALIYTSCDTFVALPGTLPLSHSPSVESISPPFPVPFTEYPDQSRVRLSSHSSRSSRSQHCARDFSVQTDTGRLVGDTEAKAPRRAGAMSDHMSLNSDAASGGRRWTSGLDGGECLVEVTERWRRVSPSNMGETSAAVSQTVETSDTSRSGSVRHRRRPSGHAIQSAAVRQTALSTGDLQSSLVPSADHTETATSCQLAGSSVSLDSRPHNRSSADNTCHYSWQSQLTRSELQFLHGHMLKHAGSTGSNNNSSSSNNNNSIKNKNSTVIDSRCTDSDAGGNTEGLNDSSVHDITHRLGRSSLHATTSSDNDVLVTVRSASVTHSPVSASHQSVNRTESNAGDELSAHNLVEMLLLGGSDKRCLARLIRQHRHKHRERFVREMRKLQQLERKILSDLSCPSSSLPSDRSATSSKEKLKTDSQRSQLTISERSSHSSVEKSALELLEHRGGSFESTLSTDKVSRDVAVKSSSKFRKKGATIRQTAPSRGNQKLSQSSSSKSLSHSSSDHSATVASALVRRVGRPTSDSQEQQSSAGSEGERLAALLTERVRADEHRQAVRQCDRVCRDDVTGATDTQLTRSSCQSVRPSSVAVRCRCWRECNDTCTLLSCDSAKPSDSQSTVAAAERDFDQCRDRCHVILPVRRSVAYFLSVDKSWTRKTAEPTTEATASVSGVARRVLPEVRLSDTAAVRTGVGGDRPSQAGTAETVLSERDAETVVPSVSEVGDKSERARATRVQPEVVTPSGGNGARRIVRVTQRTAAGPATQNETVSLQEALQRRRPDYVRNAAARQHYIRSLVAVRLHNEQQLRRIVTQCHSTADPAAWRAISHQCHQLPRVTRAFNYWDMRRHTVRLCRRLAETHQTKNRHQQKQLRQTNQLMWKMYRQKLLQLCLKGRVDMTHGVNVLAS